MFGRRTSQPERYDVGRLVDYKLRGGGHSGEDPAYQIICDIDKTYLETQFESISQMVRIAFQDAKEKVTVKGAAAILKSLRWPDPTQPGYSRPVHFVSSSPPQLRKVLQEKLALDGLEWTSDTFKDQAYNIRKGRMDLLRQHILYKSLALLNIINQAPRSASFILIGDNAEHDAYIYLGLKLLLESKLDSESYLTYLSFAGAESDQMNELKRKVLSLPDVSISAIFIRQAPGYPPLAPSQLTEGLWQFSNYIEAAIGMTIYGFIPLPQFARILPQLVEICAFSPSDIVATWQKRKPWLAGDFSAIDQLLESTVKEIPTMFRELLTEVSPETRPTPKTLDTATILKCADEWAAKLKQKHANK